MNFSERQAIDGLDEQIVRLLNERAQLAQSIGRQKQRCGAPPYDPSREQQILERLAHLNAGPLPDGSLRAIYSEIMSACRALERDLGVAFLGPAGTFTHIACQQHFGSAVGTLPVATIADVFHEVEKDHADYGVVPVENSTEGVVSHTLDFLLESGLQICGETYVQVHQCLMGKAPLEQVQAVYSHEQALAQCQRWLRQHLQGVTLVPVSSTSQGAERAVREENAAAIGASLAATVHDLPIIAERIEDNPNNQTRFLIIGKQPTAPTGKDKTSITFMAPHRPGGLHDALGCFKEHGINLTMIVSRPNRVTPFEYRFFVDFQGHVQDPAVQRALEMLRQRCHAVAVLGAYPEAD